METIDDETSAAAMDFMDRQVKARTPFFVWMNATRMHLRTHVRPEHRDQPGLFARTEYADGMIEHDAMVGTLLKKLDDLGIANDTIVIYTADNGPHANTWPDAGITPFRSEKDTNWEGAFRVPALIRWPGHIAPGQVSNEIICALDWSPTLLAAAGVPNITMLNASIPIVAKYLDTYKEFPPSQRPASFTIDQAMEKLKQGFGR
jgi:arylsulfatase